MAWIEKRGGGFCVCERQPYGRPTRYRSMPFRTRRAAERHRTEVEDTVRAGQRYEAPRREEEAEIQAVVIAYLADLGRTRKQSTIDVYDYHMERFLLWLAGQTRVRVLTMRALSRQTLSDYWAHVRDTGARVNTANDAVRVVQRVWRWAWEHDDYGEDTPRPRTIPMRNTAVRPTGAPTWAQMDAAIAQAETEWHRRLLVLLRFTGLRLGQALALEWSDVDLDAARLTVRPEIGKTQAEGRGRTIPISGHLVTELAGWGQREGLLVQGAASASKVWALTRAAWDATEHSPSQPHHAFRKGWRTELELAGANRMAVEYMMGHDQGILGVYVDARAMGMDAAAELIPALGETRQPRRLAPMVPTGTDSESGNE